MKQGKNELGRFTSKSEDDRKVRSIRATDETWNSFGEAAEERGITRADLLELMVEDKRFDQIEIPCNTQIDVDSILEILQDALTLKSNAGGAIKARIKEAIALIEDES